MISYNKEKWGKVFFTIWSGQALSLAGSRIVQFALIWWLTKKTGSAISLTYASAAAIIPLFLFAPLIGVLVDRWDKRQILIVSDIFLAITSLVLAALFLKGEVPPYCLYGFIAIRAMGGCFHSVAINTATSVLVPKDSLNRVQGLNVSLQGGLNVTAAPIGAFCLLIMPIEAILLIDFITAIPAIAILLVIQFPLTKFGNNRKGNKSPAVFKNIAACLKYLKNLPTISMIILMMSLLNLLLVPIHALLPILVTKQYLGEAKQLALLESFLGIGMVSGGLALSTWSIIKAKAETILFGIIGLGIGVLILACTPPDLFYLAMLGAFIIGIANSFSNGPFTALVQQEVKTEMQGRVFSLITTLILGAGPIGLMLAGPLSEIFGVQTWFYISGAGCLIIGLLGITRVKSLIVSSPENI